MGDRPKPEREPDTGDRRSLLGRSPQANEPERPAVGESSSQPPAGATGAHANPIAPDQPVPPRPAMPATGAEAGPHPPAPPEGGRQRGERRLAQVDWAHWRAADRRKAPFEYPNWRT